MANIWMRGFKFPNPILPLRNLNFVQRGLPHLSREILAGTTRLNGPLPPGGNEGGGAKHNEHTTGKGTENAGKDRVSDSKNLEKKQEEKTK